MYFQSCQKKKIKQNNRWIFQCLVYKHVIYESRFNLHVVCSNISYKPLNLNLFGPDIFFRFTKNPVGLYYFKNQYLKYIAYITVSSKSSPMSIDVYEPWYFIDI